MMKKYFLLFFSLWLTACDKTASESPHTQESVLMPVKVVRPQAAVFRPNLQLNGTIAAKERIAVGTSLQGLQILTVNAEVGDRVKKGQRLATLETSNVHAQLQQHTAQLAKAKANLSSQQANLKEAENTLKRYRTLIKSDAISRQELESQQAKVKSMQAAVQAANAEIAEIQAQLADSRHQRSKAEVLAPFDGILIQRNAEKGALTDNTALFVLAKDGIMELHADANADEIARLQQGQAVQIRLSDRKIIGGTVRLLPSELDSSSRLGTVKIRLDDQLYLPSGMFAVADIQLDEIHTPLALPLSAVAFDNEKQASVMLIDAQGIAQRRAVTVGTLYQGQIAVLSGIHADDLIVKQAAAFIYEGDQVEVQLENKENRQ